MFEDMTQEKITAAAQAITEDVLKKILSFTKETGCVIQAIEIETEEEPIGQTGLSSIRQTVQAHFTVPTGHPAHPKEAPYADH
jgi:NTP pyrophosphatase (non-canonical NTP hydrolase)